MAPKPPESENPKEIIEIGQTVEPFARWSGQKIPEKISLGQFFLPEVGTVTFQITKPVGAELIEQEKGVKDPRRVSVKIVVTEPDASIRRLKETLGLVVQDGETEYLLDYSYAGETKTFDFSYAKQESTPTQAAPTVIDVGANDVPRLRFRLIDANG